MERFICSLLLCCHMLGGIYGQHSDVYETQYFSRMDMLAYSGNKVVFLYKKGNVERPQSIDQYASVSDIRGFYHYLGQLIEKEFDKLDANSLDVFGKITIHLFFDAKGEIVFYRIYLQKESFDLIPNLESHLYQIISDIKGNGMKAYGLSFSDTSKIAQAGFAFKPLLRYIFEKSN